MTNNNINTEYIYFVLNKDLMHIKIGYSKQPNKRLKTLQTSTSSNLKLLFINEGTKQLESILHKMFISCKIKNEWFYFNDEFIDIMFLLFDTHVLKINTKEELDILSTEILRTKEEKTNELEQEKERLTKQVKVLKELIEYKEKELKLN